MSSDEASRKRRYVEANELCSDDDDDDDEEEDWNEYHRGNTRTDEYAGNTTNAEIGNTNRRHGASRSADAVFQSSPSNNISHLLAATRRITDSIDQNRQTNNEHRHSQFRPYNFLSGRPNDVLSRVTLPSNAVAAAANHSTRSLFPDAVNPPSLLTNLGSLQFLPSATRNTSDMNNSNSYPLPTVHNQTLMEAYHQMMIARGVTNFLMMNRSYLQSLENEIYSDPLTMQYHQALNRGFSSFLGTPILPNPLITPLHQQYMNPPPVPSLMSQLMSLQQRQQQYDALSSTIYGDSPLPLYPMPTGNIGALLPLDSGRHRNISSTVADTNLLHTEPPSSQSDSIESDAAAVNEVHAFRDHDHGTLPSERSVIMACPEDQNMLNIQLVYLRKQIEFFCATEDDILSHTRGRNKPILPLQVGIRCRHCRDVPAGGRRKGSTYFPSTLLGIYQAAQNMSTEHLQNGLCPRLPDDVQRRLLKYGKAIKESTGAASYCGKGYWAESARSKGLVDTQDGIFFASDVSNSDSPSEVRNRHQHPDSSPGQR